MMKLSVSVKIYTCLVITLVLLSVVNLFLPQGDFVPVRELPEAKLPIPLPVLALVNVFTIVILYGGLGLLGLRLTDKLGYAGIWDSNVSNRQRFLIPAITGVGIGIFFILTDAVFSRLHPLGPLPHPPFPASIVASAAAGIGEEIIFRLFFIPFFVWLISWVILKKRWQNQIFWIVTALSALAFSSGHLPSAMLIYGFKKISDIPPALLAEVIILNGVVSFFAAFNIKKSGFLAAVGVHFWTDIVWHVIRGLF